MKGKKYPVRLTEDEKNRLREILKKGNHPARQTVRANILLRLNGEQDKERNARPVAGQAEIAKQCNCQAALVYKVSKQYAREGIDRVLNRKVRETPPVAKIITGEAEAKIIALCCGEPPPGYSRWTLRLLGTKAVETGIVEHISASAAGKVLKKNPVNRT
jgi:transposase